MNIKPFKAYRFNPEIVGNAGDCISPPYDVIDDNKREQLYNANPHNIVRIILGKTTPADNDKNNQYTRAAEYLNDWIKSNALKQDAKDALYFYVQNFDLQGKNVQRYSFIALAELEAASGKVKPHENTLDGPKADRLKLQLACKANFGLIFMLYADPALTAEKNAEILLKQTPALDFTDDLNVRHRIFPETDPNRIAAVKKMMDDKSCIIADGHHRYETAINYYKQTGDPAAKFQMMAFSNTESEALQVLATHRVAYNLPNFTIEKLLADLKTDFTITNFNFDSDASKQNAKKQMLALMADQFAHNKNAYGIYAANNAFYVATLKNPDAMKKMVPEMSDHWRNLNVSVLHKLILEKLLGIGQKELATESNLDYVKDTENAITDCIEKVDARQKQVVFFMNPEKMETIRQVTEVGEKMPQKSTYFYPKVFTGLTINKL